jgi:hypothetical protein
MNPDNIYTEDRPIPSEFVKRVLDNKLFAELLLKWVIEYDSAKADKHPELKSGIDDVKCIVQQKMRNAQQFHEYLS